MANNDEQLSLKDVIFQLRDWIKFLWSKWLVILIAGIAGAGLGLFYAYWVTPTYSASTSFVLSNYNSQGGILGLASQFGIDLGSGSDDVFTGDNIIALMKSRRMMQEALLKKPADSRETLLNIITKEMKLDKAWNSYDRTKGAFPFPDDTTKMTSIQDSLFRDVYIRVADKMVDVSQPDKKQAIYAVTTTSSSEVFSYFLTKYLVNVTSKFYIDTKTSNARDNLNMIQHEADSIRALLGNAITATGSETDRTFNLNPAYQVQRSGAAQAQAQTQALGIAYGEIVKDLEVAKITLQKETPLYQIIDEPALPLLIKKPSRLLSLIFGGILAGFLTCGFLVGRKILSNLK